MIKEINSDAEKTTEVLSFRVFAEERNQVENEASELKVSKSVLLRKIIKEHYERENYEK